jgi:LPS sulfotransferase NodH
MSALGDVETFLRRRYLFLRQQVRHLQAGWAHFTTSSLPAPRFILFGRGRSGTTALVSMLDALPGVRCEGEVLHNYVPFPYRHVLGRAARHPTKTYGCKILSYQIRDVQRPPGPRKDFLRRLHDEHGFQILYLRRTHLLRHALSNIRARRDTFHRKKTDADTDRNALHVDPDHVIEWMESSKALNAYEQTLLDDVPHLSLTYEEHIRHADDHQSTVDSVCDFLGIESAPVESRYRKVAPSSLRDRVANYDELADRLQGTQYDEYLE